MSYTGPRKERIVAERLSNKDFNLGTLGNVESGSVTWKANAHLQAGGYITLEDMDQEINYSKDRIRLWWEIIGEERWPLGVFVIAAPDVEYREDGRSRKISLIDKITLIKESVILGGLQLTSGSNIVQAMVDQIQATGETRIAFTSSDSVLTNDVSWDPGTSRLRIINDLAAMCGYWSLWTDRQGQFRVEPYIDPADRVPVYDFIEGETSIHSADWEYELDLWNATNTVLLISQADEDDNVMYAYAIDDNPNSPTSTISMGRALNSIVEENVEADSQESLQEQANRKLRDNSNVAGKISVSHRPIPIWYNEAVSFKSQGFEAKAVVVDMKLNLKPGSLVRATWRQI